MSIFDSGLVPAMPLIVRLRMLGGPCQKGPGNIYDDAADCINQLETELKSMTRQKDEWHGRAAESVRLRRERDEAWAALREIATIEPGAECQVGCDYIARKALGLTAETKGEQG